MSALVKKRLELNQLLGDKREHNQLQTQVINQLHQHVVTMVPDNFLVRRHLAKVTEFSDRQRWNQLTPEDVKIIKQNLAPLPNTLPPENHLVKRFDLLCLKLQIAILKNNQASEKNKANSFSLSPSSSGIILRDQVRDLAQKLAAKKDIPMVKKQLPFIEEVQSLMWWQDVTIEMIEELRHNLRDLIQFIDIQAQAIVYTNFEDELAEIDAVDIPLPQPGFSYYQYRQKIATYVRENQDQVVIAKIKENLPLIESDLRDIEKMLFASEIIESRQRFEQVFGANISLKLLIRQLVGLDNQAAKKSFSQHLKPENLSVNQVKFVEIIIDYLTQNGVMDAALLYEPPFTDVHQEGFDGVFSDLQAEQIIKIIKSFNETVEAKFDIA